MESFWKIAFLVLVICASSALSAQRMSGKIDRSTAIAGEAFQLSYTIKDAPRGNFIAPNFQDLQVISGPNKFSEQTIENGRRSSVETYTYGLIASKPGAVILEPARYQTSKKVFDSNKIKIPVKKSELTGKPMDEGPLADIFFRIEIDTNRVCIGQQLNADYVVYSLYQISNFNDLEIPSLTGFWMQDNSPKRINPKTVIKGGKQYFRYEVKKFALFPQRPGELVIDGIKAEMTYRKSSGQKRGFFRNYRNMKKKTSCKDEVISVYPTPEKDKPENFSGGVGSFKVAARVDPNIGRVGEAMEYRVSIVGSGNIMLLSPPDFDFPKSAEIFEPEESENIYEQDGVIMGSKTFSYSIIPKEEGELVIPPVQFDYYDPKSGSYRKSRSNVLKVKIREGDPERMKEMAKNKSTRDIAALSTKFEEPSSVTGYGWPVKVGLLVLWAAPFFMIPAFIKRKRSEEEENADVEGRKQRAAIGVAKKKLATAKGYMESENREDFYDEIVKAVYGFLNDRVGVKGSEASIENIARKLGDRGIDSGKIARVEKLIEYCEMALYAPVTKTVGLKATYDEALELIVEIEENLN